MSHLTERTALQVYEWYLDIERRLTEVVRVLPFIEAAELHNVRSPRLASILLEAASLVDTLLRDQLPSRFTRPDGKTTTKRYATIVDYKRELDPTLRLSTSQSLLLHGMPSLLSPFSAWTYPTVQTLKWWDSYNKLKHDRLASSVTVTLEDCLYAMCALNHVMMRLPTISTLVFRFGWAQIAGYNPQIAIQDLTRPTPQPYVAYTEFFATFLCEFWFASVDDVRPIMFRNSERLQSHLGRLGNMAESR